jgi:ABC-2 type transport system permease protein
MIRIFDITRKDLLQLRRDRKTFFFLLIMPVVFTFLFGFAFGGFGGAESDSRLPVGFVNQDFSWLSDELHNLLANSQVIRLEGHNLINPANLKGMVGEGELAGGIIIPPGYGKALISGKSNTLILITDTSTPAGKTVQAEVLAISLRLDSAVQTAIAMEAVAGDSVPFDYAFEQALIAWDDPPIAVSETTSSIAFITEREATLANISPGMMLQFAIAGLLTAAQVIVNERKSRSLQRLLTTKVRRIHILIGHYLAILVMISIQFFLLLIFGQFILKVNYLKDPAATLLVAFASAMCISAMGLLIGVIAKNEEQAVVLSLIPMFILAGLGGAMVPLEITGETFQMIGHISPVAWAMDGFKNITIRGLEIESTFIPAAALVGYAALFFILAALRLQATQES